MSVSISEARKLYLSHCENKNRPRTVSDYTRLLKLHLPTGNLDNLTRRSIMDKLTELSHVPAEQSHEFTAISVFLNFCVQRGWLENNPLIGLKKLGTIKTRDRVLSPEEMAIVYKKATIYPFGHNVRMCILTGMRRGEVANLRRSRISIQNRGSQSCI